MFKNINRYFWLFLALLIVVPATNIYADGSKNLYPSGAKGGRAYLRASTTESLAFPFPNLGTHFVYAEVGEQIALATSAQAYGNTDHNRNLNRQNIKLYGPNGVQIALTVGSDSDTRGRIDHRTAELAGPQLPSQTGGSRYTPIYHNVSTTGIYKVEFLSTSRSVDGDERLSYVAADSDWTQGGSSNYLAAWDISVAKWSGSSWSWVPGRVYTNVLNMDNPSFGSNSSFFRDDSGFYGKFKVLTRDGYMYNVDNNGSQGISFTFMVNNRGFHVEGSPNVPAYTSISSPNAEAVQDRYHNPNDPDAEAAVTHKIFYSLPDQNMPISAIGGPVAGQTTWLRPVEKDLDVTELVVVGAEGNKNKLGNKGAYIEFYNESGGDYYIDISPKPGSSVQFPVRYLSGSSQFGDNRVYWDGKDGEGQSLPHGLADVNVELKLRGAEVHFPYIDMELNHNGIIIELLRKSDNYTTAVSDKVFWDDRNIRDGGGNNGSKTNPRNASHTEIPDGTSSNTNGHIWGTGSDRTSGTFGDEHGMDTWTFIEGDAISVDFEVDVRIADLYTDITSLSVNGEPSSSASQGDEVTFTVVVGNDGPSNVEDAPFSFILPPGFEPVGTPVFNGGECYTQSPSIDFDATSNTYNVLLDLHDKCEVTYTFTAKITSNVTPGTVISSTATIMRPHDVSDPDATNISNPQKPEGDLNVGIDIENYYYLPTDPFFECEYNGLDDACNNISSAVINISTNSTFAVDDFVETEQNTPVSGNVLDNDYDPQDDMQAVSNAGTHTTKEGGSITIDANGNYTYTPPTNFSGLDQFEYIVCDNGSPQACDNAVLLIGVGVCTVDVNGEFFDWRHEGGSGTVTQTIVQPPSNYGFAFDIYELDNSFNMEINGTKIAVHEIEFQSNGTPGINVQFLDGDQYETDTEDIWGMKGDADNPLVRVIISPTGSVSLWGSKTSGGELFPLILTSNNQGQNSFNTVPWNSVGTNTIIVTQNVVGVTLMDGYGYGQNITPCVNYWMGGSSGVENEWSVPENWTDNRVPLMGEDVEFATVDNYGTAAVEDLYLDDLNQNNSGGRIIGNLINNSDKNLIITTGNQLSIEGKVEEKVQQSDESYGAGTIVVKSTNIPTDASDPVNEPSGTLIVNPDENPNGVEAIVEFYNKAYDCADCGFYTRSWQYFGVPVEESGSTTFPQSFTSSEEVNEWSEPTNGNKWITPDMPLTAFTGYQITRNEESEPTFANAVHKFNGLLNLGDASVALTRTNNVNYSGMNLIGNSYTAAIPISADAISFPTGVDSTVYLFNTGTRDQWRKLNGTAINQDGYRSGQYLAVPVNVGGQNHFPDRIPSMHSFMVRVESGTGGNLTIDYSKLVKNTTVALGDGSTQIVTRSANATSDNESTSASSIPSLVMDVIGEESADRVWIFAKEGTTHGFDNGWDGRKMSESEIAQLYVTGSDESVLQVATVPSMNNVDLGFEADADGKYTFEFMASEHLRNAQIFLYDKLDGSKHLVTNGSSYSFEAKKGEPSARFSLTQEGGFESINEEAFIDVLVTDSGNILVRNRSGNSCSVFISNDKGGLLQHVEVGAKSEVEIDGVSTGLYIVRLQNSVLKDVRRVRID